VNLSLTGATSSSIDIYRNSVLIVAISNDGFYTDTPMAAAMRSQQIIGYNVFRTTSFFGTESAALLVEARVDHALCKIKRAQ
jgi:hypothetical protein